MVAQPGGVWQDFQAQRHLRDRLVPEVVVGAAGGQHQEVVGDIGAAPNLHRPRHQVDAGYRSLTKTDIRRVAEYGAQRIGDVGGV